MKPIQFNVPVPKHRTIFIQEDFLDRFYPFMHRHIEHQLIWIKAGEGHLLVDDHVHPFRADDVFFIGSDQAHVFKSGTASDKVHSISLFFNPSGPLNGLFQMPEMEPIALFLDKCRQGFQVPVALLSMAHQHLSAMQRADGVDRLVHFMYLFQELSRYMNILSPLSGVTTQVDILSRHRILNVCQYIDRHFREPITLEDISAQINLTPQAFCRFFKKSTGKTYITYLNEVRVKHACRLLVDGKFDQVSMVAIVSGFSSVTNFNRVFLKTVGVSPTRYLENYRNILHD